MGGAAVKPIVLEVQGEGKQQGEASNSNDAVQDKIRQKRQTAGKGGKKDKVDKAQLAAKAIMGIFALFVLVVSQLGTWHHRSSCAQLCAQLFSQNENVFWPLGRVLF